MLYSSDLQHGCAGAMQWDLDVGAAAQVVCNFLFPEFFLTSDRNVRLSWPRSFAVLLGMAVAAPCHAQFWNECCGAVLWWHQNLAPPG